MMKNDHTLKTIWQNLAKKDYLRGNKIDRILETLKINNNIWENALRNLNAESFKGKRILIATSMADYQHAASLDRILAIALVEKGHKVSFLLCDEDLQACQLIKYQPITPIKLINHSSTPRCVKCAPKISKMFAPMKLPIYTFDFSNNVNQLREFENKISDLSIAELENYIEDDINLGEQARAGVIRYFASTNFDEEIYSREILKRFLLSSYVVTKSCEKLNEKFSPDVVIAHHGIYVPQGTLVEFFKKKNCKVVTWTPSYRRGTFIFSPDESYHHAMITEEPTSWENIDLNRKKNRILKKYMNARSHGGMDWIRFSDTRTEGSSRNFKGRDFYLALTSVSWDAELHYKSRAFPNMKSWLEATVAFFKDNPHLNLVIRIHPAELTSPNKSREPMAQFLANLNISSYSNISVIPPENKLSTYKLIDKARVILIYNTKTGIEAAYMGKPVITAGEAWLKGKGISFDAFSPSEYLKLLEKFSVKKNMNKNQIYRAKKYAYHFFFRRMIKIKLFAESNYDDLLPNRIISWEELIGKYDKNFQEILNALIHNHTPYSLEP